MSSGGSHNRSGCHESCQLCRVCWGKINTSLETQGLGKSNIWCFNTRRFLYQPILLSKLLKSNMFRENLAPCEIHELAEEEEVQDPCRD